MYMLFDVPCEQKKKGNKQRAILELFQSEKEINTNESD